MFQPVTAPAEPKPDFYRLLDKQLQSLLGDERNYIANSANFAALVYLMLPNLNWAGFYFLQSNDLVLGPFQGKPACIRIPVYPTPRGVCGYSAFQRKALIVPNVHEFPDHIACDSASNSEVVIPLIDAERVIGVLDLDSPLLARFDHDDLAGLSILVNTFIKATDFSRL